ncbi:hypothetical protein HNR46_002180 [Haloferula luteola]|uniref:Uncharacterized protein n=1 Tax=Haloferula luteola TaxID=595692 RepID=A0A840VGN1_9BACT|nr:hypothetical protein [Haloferula luteola]MBB5351941.1 hypothetical protein [Haloferula luteola]
MKSPLACLLAFGALAATSSAAGYTNYIRQVMLETTPEIHWDLENVAAKGEGISPAALSLSGSRYELWTVKNADTSGTSAVSYLLDTAFVSAYSPAAEIVIHTLDPDGGDIPRTRVDQPFSVDVTVSGLLTGDDAPAASKSVRLLHHTQSYGDTYGENVDRSQANLFDQRVIESNGVTTLEYEMTNLTGADLTQVRGEERFSVYTHSENGALDEQLASRFVKVWPLTRVQILGLEWGETYRFEMPQVTIEVDDMYPKSYTYTQIYKGAPSLGTVGTKIPQAQKQIDQSKPLSRTWVIGNLGSLIDEDGQWTLEVVTETVFGVERLALMTFEVDRSLEVRSLLSTLE